MATALGVVAGNIVPACGGRLHWQFTSNCNGNVEPQMRKTGKLPVLLKVRGACAIPRTSLVRLPALRSDFQF